MALFKRQRLADEALAESSRLLHEAEKLDPGPELAAKIDLSDAWLRRANTLTAPR